MKTLKLDHNLAVLVGRGEKTSTGPLLDDKEDLAVNDEVQLIDTVDADNPGTWRVIGTATINQIVQKRLGELSEDDMGGHEEFRTRHALLAMYRRYYGADISWQTPVKVVHFTFSSPAARAKPNNTPPLRPGKVVVYADGGSRGNPGPSASGYIIYDDQGAPLVQQGVYLGVTTNNQAEYTALKLVLEEAHRLGAREVAVYMDSMLVINQMKGIFKVKNRDLWPIHSALKELCQQFKHVSFTQVPREMNKLADAVVNEVLDAQQANTEVVDKPDR